MKRLPLLLAVAATLIALGVQAQALTDGEVRKIDKSAAKVTLKHAEIKTLGVPPMTMVYRAQSPSMLEPLKVGDKVRFAAQKREGIYTVTHIEVVR